MRKTKTQKGITLVALIITIVVLLILAAVSINAIQNEGIMGMAQGSADKFNQSQENEQVILGGYEDELKNYSGNEDNSSVKVLDIANQKVNQTTTAYDSDGGKIVVPAGYKIVVDETTNNAATVVEGIVIKDEFGNEWVWIPAVVSEISEVVNGKNVGKLYSFTTTGATAMNYPTKLNSGRREPDVVTNASEGVDSTTGNKYDAANLLIVLEGEYANEQTVTSFKAQLQDEFDNMIESVSLYGGYYIGRYETGGSINSPVLQQGATVIKNTSSSSNWYQMYTSAKKLAANDCVTTGMIWGCQWDNTLRWLVSSNNLSWADLKDSRGWGNYKNSEGNAAINSGTGKNAGHSEYWKAGNIYDLAGNYSDWTLEAFGTNARIDRGGNYSLGGDVFPASRMGYDFPTGTWGDFTFRATLIIE